MTVGACGRVGMFRLFGQLEATPSTWCIADIAWAATVSHVDYFGPPANDACGLHIVVPGEEGH